MRCMVSDNLLILDKVIKKTQFYFPFVWIYLNGLNGVLNKQMSKGKKYFGWENYPVKFVSNKFK